MKGILLFTLIAYGSNCLAGTIEKGDYLDVQFDFNGCESNIFHTEVVEIKGVEPITIYFMQEIQPVGKTERQIERQLKLQIENTSVTITGQRLEEINVNILKTEPKPGSKKRHYVHVRNLQCMG